MDPQPVDLGPVVRETVELLLDLAPVELGPAREQRAHVLDVRAVLPARAGYVIRPPCPPDPLAQIGEHVVVHGDGERLDLDRGSVCAAKPRTTTGRLRRVRQRPVRPAGLCQTAGDPMQRIGRRRPHVRSTALTASRTSVAAPPRRRRRSAKTPPRRKLLADVWASGDGDLPTGGLIEGRVSSVVRSPRADPRRRARSLRRRPSRSHAGR